MSDHAPGDGAERLAEPLRSRWSPSWFDADETLTREQVETLVQAARWAPSAGNAQPWVLIVAERGTPGRAVLDQHLSRGNAWVRRPALVLLACAQVAADPDAPPDRKPPRDPAYAHHAVGQAAAHVTLQARADGLEAHQFSGFDRDAVATALGVPAHYRLLAGIAVGHRGDPAAIPDAEREREARERRRKPLTEVARTRWDQAW